MGVDGLFAWGTRTFLMAVINVTTDSFSGDGIANAADIATEAGRLAQDADVAGADIIDIGAMSTRPGAAEIPVEVERERIRTALEGVTAATSLPVSVDTYRPDVAEVAIGAGATVINSIWGITGKWGADRGSNGSEGLLGPCARCQP